MLYIVWSKINERYFWVNIGSAVGTQEINVNRLGILQWNFLFKFYNFTVDFIPKSTIFDEFDGKILKFVFFVGSTVYSRVSRLMLYQEAI